jgi:hypothetical protein
MRLIGEDGAATTVDVDTLAPKGPHKRKIVFIADAITGWSNTPAGWRVLQYGICSAERPLMHAYGVHDKTVAPHCGPYFKPTRH